MQTLAFIGLGNMGLPMAQNLLKAGFALRVFDLSSAVMKIAEQSGAIVCGSAAEACEGALGVITMLPAGQHVRSLFLGPEGLIKRLPKDFILLDCSTIDAQTARELHDASALAQLKCLDAPVSGGVKAAQAGSLTFMCGGDADAFAAGKPILEAMGLAVFHAGPKGAGQVAKICNNMLLAIHMIGTAEALTLGHKNGLDPAILSEIMLASSGKNWSLEKYNPYPGVMPASPASNDYKPGFMVDLMAKDLGLAMDNAQQMKAQTPLGELAQGLYLKKQAQGDGQRDFSSIIELLS